MAISRDDDVRQSGMRQRWKLKHVQLFGDPGGENYLKPLDLWDPVDLDGVGLPAVLLIGADGQIHHRQVGRDFADRTADVELFEALHALELDPIEPPTGSPDLECPEDIAGHFKVAKYNAYFAGNRNGAIAIHMRLKDPESIELARQHEIMSDESINAWAKIR